MYRGCDAVRLWLTGNRLSPSESCVYVAKDGALSSALVEQTGGISVDENELKQYLETAVIHFNEEKGQPGRWHRTRKMPRDCRQH